MIRFILKRRIKDKYNAGLEEEYFETFDLDVPMLQTALSAGGTGEGHYDMRTLLGVELLPDPEAKP